MELFVSPAQYRGKEKRGIHPVAVVYFYLVFKIHHYKPFSKYVKEQTKFAASY